ncbi:MULTISPECIES: YbhB/YbcL family Raf kinase inhibitor-like protein [unclassified Undibacterium]|uniref:YbhB/YbcL family Raf kinase inhibitor-like protein n=1 Tax=unclassified Undibacterium TaxID=2630295 RepID=UPI002AC8BCB2|nr:MULTISPECIES: YbhB/YbcL family Raf kinase inhibitor-like protein [unclassified Undibacterium]MEB0140077.1 YbhB/YbcL family Raf kinase inhibitor-like protein [Undibacterium sp. CCC2.1]MEB0173187.1 YbhB/YbcL family Raf kinase inhibitor-like protein [Undibacterium sp. CCC1.1]MEB0176886.1 YbhB/YbcL family Raf kinase inhibitor-like protein [Undibacterium sp. CCC3.4]MEB0216201.1 YbhB/YbcL family Raf kinase inhibitor-like protein [Undibacterium sp. 5I2]WPX41959.1 YbhB/YbcL family Raf kinase inhibi
MKLSSEAFENDGLLPPAYAFGKIDPQQHVAWSSNRNPPLAWSDVPPGTRSFVLLCHDPDVPSRGDDVNRADRQVPADLARVDFFHWTLIDLPATLRHIAAGAYSDGVTPRGKPGPELADSSARQGLNDYTGWFAGDADMAGEYFGYDGPCPPWNDSIEHHYIFTLYALDIAQLPLSDRIDGATVRAALAPHILAQAQVCGRYSLNPALSAA